MFSIPSNKFELERYRHIIFDVVSFGSNDTRKIDISPLGSVVTSNIISSTVWVDADNKAYTTSSISIDSEARTAETIGSNVYFYVSGSVGNDDSIIEAIAS